MWLAKPNPDLRTCLAHLIFAKEKFIFYVLKASFANTQPQGIFHASGFWIRVCLANTLYCPFFNLNLSFILDSSQRSLK
jgi:hypothetical protein